MKTELYNSLFTTVKISNENGNTLYSDVSKIVTTDEYITVYHHNRVDKELNTVQTIVEVITK